MSDVERNETIQLTPTQKRNAQKRATAERAATQLPSGRQATESRLSLSDRVTDWWQNRPEGSVAVGAAVAVGLLSFAFENAQTLATLANTTKTVVSLFSSPTTPVTSGPQAVMPQGKQKASSSPVVATIASVCAVPALLYGVTRFPRIQVPSLSYELSAVDDYPAVDNGCWKVEWTGYSTTRALLYGAAAALVLYGTYKVVRHIWRRQGSPIGAEWTTPFIGKTLRKGALSSSQQRQIFVNTQVSKAGATKNHTHGQSAADRNAGGTTASLFAASLGLEPYFVQQSLADIRKFRDGDRSYHWAKDLAVPPRPFHFNTETQCAILVDVDYYIDMPRLLATHPGTYLIYAFTPTVVAKGRGEYTFRFDEDNKVIYDVTGGAKYHHEVWDYCGDTFVVEDVAYTEKRISGYHVDRKYIDANHSIVLLSLLGTFSAPSLCPADWFIEGRKLERLKPVFTPGLAVLDVKDEEGLSRSVAIVGDHLAVTMPKDTLDAMRAIAMTMKVPITPATVASNAFPSDPAGLPTERLPPGWAAVICNYVRAGLPIYPPVVYPPSECLRSVYFDKHDYSHDMPLAGFGSPLIGPCYSFPKSIGSDNAMVEGRIETLVRKECPSLPPSFCQYMIEFAERLVLIAHRGHPVDESYVRNKQDSASQKAILDKATVTGPNTSAKWSSFMKLETYEKPTDPRNISQAEPDVKFAYSSYTYAFHDQVMSGQEWYAFNKTPLEVSERICKILRDQAWSICADGNRWDGNMKRSLRVLERICMLRHFAREHHSDLNENMDKQIAIPGKTTEGRKYWSGFSRGSGSGETADLNSVSSAFIAYCGKRMTTVNGAYLTADQAWALLGVYGGDDSLDGATDPEALKKAATILGQDYDCILIPRGELGVEFLNRKFSREVWEGNPNSLANPSRLLSKLFVGPAKLPNVLQRLGERLSGYYRMDCNSPVIGKLTQISHELLGDYVEGQLMPWGGEIDKDNNWPNEDAGWMDEVFDKSIPDFDHARFNCWIIAVALSKDPGMLLRAPLCTGAIKPDPIPKKACVVGDSFVPRPLPPTPVEDEEESEFYIEDLQEMDVLPPLETDYVNALDEPVPAPFLEAEKVVPRANTDGKRIRDKLLPKKPLPKEPAVKRTCTHKKRYDKDGELKLCPCLWDPPRKGKDEKADVYGKRLLTWSTKRRQVAKQYGVDANFNALNGNNGSVTNTDDHSWMRGALLVFGAASPYLIYKRWQHDCIVQSEQPLRPVLMSEWTQPEIWEADRYDVDKSPMDVDPDELYYCDVDVYDEDNPPEPMELDDCLTANMTENDYLFMCVYGYEIVGREKDHYKTCLNIYTHRQAHRLYVKVCQINGNQGSWTNSDDTMYPQNWRCEGYDHGAGCRCFFGHAEYEHLPNCTCFSGTEFSYYTCADLSCEFNDCQCGFYTHGPDCDCTHGPNGRGRDRWCERGAPTPESDVWSETEDLVYEIGYLELGSPMSDVPDIEECDLPLYHFGDDTEVSSESFLEACTGCVESLFGDIAGRGEFEISNIEIDEQTKQNDYEVMPHNPNKRSKNHPPKEHKPKAKKQKKQHYAKSRVGHDETVAVAQNRTTRSGRAKITSQSNGVVYEHMEKFADVTESMLFTTQGYYINPGNSQLFPWLSTEAVGYQEFVVEHLEVIFVSKTGSNTVGSVMIGCDYDVESPLPSSDTSLDAYIGTVECAPWKNAVWRADQKSMKALSAQKYILQGYATNDLKTYCPGNIILATMDGAATTAKWGKLWVKYRIRLLTPQLATVAFNNALIGGTVFGNGGTFSPADCLGSNPTLDPQAVGLALIQRPSGGFSVQLPSSGGYMCVAILAGTSLVSVTTLSYGGGVSAATVSVVTSGTTLMQCIYLVAPVSTNKTLGQVWFSANAATLTSANFRFAAVPYGSINITLNPPDAESSAVLLAKYLQAREKESKKDVSELAKIDTKSNVTGANISY